MANNNIIVDDEGNRLFDDNGHLVLVRALGINRFQQSANGSFLQSPLAARQRKNAPHYIPASFACYSALEYLHSNNYLTPIRGYSLKAFSTVTAAKPFIDISNGIVFNKPSSPNNFYSYGCGKGRDQGLDYSSRLGVSYPLAASYDSGTIFEIVWDRPFVQYLDIYGAPAVAINSADNHALYTSGDKTVWDWETALSPVASYLTLGLNRIKIGFSLAALYGSYVSIVIRATGGREPDNLTPAYAAQPEYDYFVGDTYRDVSAMIPRILVTPP